MGINVFMQCEINLDFKAINEIEHFKDRDQKGGHDLKYNIEYNLDSNQDLNLRLDICLFV